jgi:hypothetical protein
MAIHCELRVNRKAAIETPSVDLPTSDRCPAGRFWRRALIQ